MTDDDSQPEALSQPMTIGIEAYTSPQYARAEGDKLWARVWQQVGRVEEIPSVGDYLTYQVLDDSIIITRTAAGLRAYYNVCSHRGRRLIDTPAGAHDARGNKKGFTCGYHGWGYDLDGQCVHVSERGDWPPERLTSEKIRLGPVRVDTWAGWIFICMDPGAEPLRDYLEPAATLLEPFQLENMRYRWRRWLVFDCNWKVALEAFMETYHVPYTHPEFMAFGSFLGWARNQGRHSNIGYDAPKGLEENQGKVRLGSGADARAATRELQEFTWENSNTNTTQTLVDVAERLMDDLPEGTTSAEVLRYWLDTARQVDAERGVHWPVVAPQDVAKAGTAWQVFPNFQIGHGINNMLCYSARPYGYDPGKCVFEAAVYELYPPGQEPATQWEYTPQDDPRWRTVLPQDFSNMAAVQQGMKARGFTGPKPNPYRERSVVSLHHNLARYMGTGAPTEL